MHPKNVSVSSALDRYSSLRGEVLFELNVFGTSQTIGNKFLGHWRDPESIVAFRSSWFQSRLNPKVFNVATFDRHGNGMMLRLEASSIN